ncbi:MAG: CRISPR-associated endonuclease Cas1 [Planctomycetia bacterium]
MLAPPERIGSTLHMATPEARVGRSGSSIVVAPPDDAPSIKTPVGNVDAVVVQGPTQMSTQAIILCVDHDLPVHWVTTTGRHVASLMASVGQAQRRVRHYRAPAEPAERVRLAKLLVRTNVEGQYR